MDGVLFDLDDTLVDQASAAASAVVAWMGEDRPGLVARWTGVSALHYRRFQDRELTYDEQRRARVRDLLEDPSLRDDEADAAFDTYRHHYDAACVPFPDALPTLRRARDAGLRVGVLTNGMAERQVLKAARAGITTVVDVVVASSALPVSKPHPAAFHAACGRLGTEPGATLMVGDSLADDVHGASAAGLPRSCWTGTTPTRTPAYVA
ncbi:HAD family hydrolase [Nocardioides aestuarii]|uniref:HAD family hydrolase n=1 Tax=Nocardioides aestuarii TaxID=252231 RepID=A0ABW4TNJ8_9ACTN